MQRLARPLVLILIVLSIGFVAYLFFGTRVPTLQSVYYHPRYASAVYTLSGNAHVSQAFKADYPGLDRIDLFFQHQGAGEDGTILFQLKDSCTSEQTITTIAIDYATIVDEQPQPFRFPPLDDSANRAYCFIVTSQSTDQTAMGIYGSSYADTYPFGQANYQTNTLPTGETETPTRAFAHHAWLPMIYHATNVLETFDIGFTLHYNGPAETTLQTLLTRLAANKPFLFGRAGFYIFLLVLYLVIFGLFFRAASRIDQGPKL
ncbi:MAG: hypothetical protein KDJ52_16505 [Anaerolineae bacterium]|nr:hypothetical protein [Anaerolineae bacterium]